MFNELLEEIKIKQPVIHFVEKLFKQNNSQEAIAFFEREENKQFIEKVNVKDCVEVIFPEEMLFTNVWKQDKNFVEPNNSKEKQILRDLIDMGYVIPCEDFLRPEIIFRTTFLLLQKGMLCIAAEFFATACSYIQGMQEYWDKLKDDCRPNLRGYIEKFADKDINLDYMSHLLKS